MNDDGIVSAAGAERLRGQRGPARGRVRPATEFAWQRRLGVPHRERDRRPTALASTVAQPGEAGPEDRSIGRVSSKPSGPAPP